MKNNHIDCILTDIRMPRCTGLQLVQKLDLNHPPIIFVSAFADVSFEDAFDLMINKAGIKQLETFEDGESAWNWLASHPEPHLIITEWRVPKVSTPQLVQRIRGHGYIKVPIVVVSSLIQADEVPLVNEIGVDTVINKPFEEVDFWSSIIWTLQQNSNFKNGRLIEVELLRLNLVLGK